MSKFIEGKDKVKDAKRGTATCLVIGTGVKIVGMDAKRVPIPVADIWNRGLKPLNLYRL